MNLAPNSMLRFNSRERLLALSLFLFLFVYLILRAIYVPLLHDEIGTFFYYVQSGNYLPPNAHWDANNHVLNSVLTHFSYALFGQSPLALRLPNVLSFLLFFWAAFNLAGRAKWLVIRWALLCSLVMTTYIFEYQGECRGYGMSLAFLLAAIEMLVRYSTTFKWVHLVLMCVLLFLATSANLTLLISSSLLFFAAFCFAVIHFRNKFKWLLFHALLMGVLAMPFWFLVKLSFKLKELGLLYYGSKAGFFGITLPSLSKQYLGSDNIMLQWLLVLIAAVMLIIFIISLMKRLEISSASLVFVLLLFGSLIMIQFLAHFLGVNYPEDRTAMYLYIYLAAAFLLVLDNLAAHISAARWFSLIGFFLPMLFIANLSLRSSVFSSEERHSQAIFDIINKEPWTGIFPPTVGGYRTQEFCWYYMSNCAGGHQGRLHWTNHPGLDADYQLVSTAFRFNPETYTYYDSIYRDEANGLVLFKRKRFLERKLISENEVPITNDCRDAFYNLGKYRLDSLGLQSKTLFVGVDMTLESEVKPFNAWLVAGADNAAGENIVYEYIPLQWLRPAYKDPSNKIRQGTLIHHVPAEAVSLTFYLWNIKEKPFSIGGGKCYLYSLERDFELSD